MPMTAIMMGMMLTLLGVAGAIASHMHGGKMVTALIPAMFGVIFIALGAGSLAKPALRKHLMHGLAMLALIGAIMPVARAIIAWSGMRPMAKFSMIGMAIICLLTLVFCIQSFIAARKARLATTA
jgi:hypothetical protein